MSLQTPNLVHLRISLPSQVWHWPLGVLSSEPSADSLASIDQIIYLQHKYNQKSNGPTAPEMRFVPTHGATENASCSFAVDF